MAPEKNFANNWDRWPESQHQPAPGNVRYDNPSAGGRQYTNQSRSYVPTGTTLQSSSVQEVWTQKRDQELLDQGEPPLIHTFRRYLQNIDLGQTTRNETPQQGRETRLRLDSANAPPFNPSSQLSSNAIRMPSEHLYRDNNESRYSIGHAHAHSHKGPSQDSLGLGGLNLFDGPSDQPTMTSRNWQSHGQSFVSDTRPTHQQLNAGSGLAGGRRQLQRDSASQHFPAYSTYTLDWQSAQPGFPQLQAPYLHHFNRAAGHTREPTPVESQLEQFMDPKLREYLQVHSHDRRRREAYTLEKIRGSIVAFCTQQTGSRFIQNELGKANTKEKELVFNEMLPELLRLSEDQSGNYVVQKIIECGSQLQKTAILSVLRGKLGQLAKNNQASRVVQRLLEKILVSEQHVVLDDMRPIISDLCRHKNGHHLVLVALNTVENRGQLDFIYDCVRGKVLDHARDENGCMVLQTMLEKGTEQDRDFICAELRGSYQELCTHAKGNFVVQKVLEHCRPELRNKLVQIIIANVVSLSKAKSGSHVVETLYRLGITVDERHAIVNNIMGCGGTAYEELCVHQYGNYVIRTILIDLGNYDNAWLAAVWREKVYNFLQVAKASDGKTKKAIDALIDTIHGILSAAPRSPSQDSSSPAHTPNLTMEPNSPTSNSPSTNDSALDEPLTIPLPFAAPKAYKPSPYTNGVKPAPYVHYKCM